MGRFSGFFGDMVFFEEAEKSSGPKKKTPRDGVSFFGPIESNFCRLGCIFSVRPVGY